jgi:hypothetical protein
MTSSRGKDVKVLDYPKAVTGKTSCRENDEVERPRVFAWMILRDSCQEE